jgi:hypothetical protein
MRTVHETEALRPSDPVPKHHSSNPSNKFQRIKLVLSEEKRSAEKGSTPASPSSHPPNSATLPPAPETDHSNDNIIYIQDPVTNATMVQFPPDVVFTPRELALPADQLFRLLRRQLHWATQDGDQLRAEAESLEKQRKDEWAAKELLLENVMEGELESAKRRLVEAGEDEPHHFAQLEADVAPSKKLRIQPKAGKIPWWREEDWLHRHEGGEDNEIIEESLPTF